ncbi:hypothetical protein KUF54_13825 [Comamonas sp. Y33R10-2]|uniref:hypothetical protein n=1 Tax=Comamonas sp. Y33R10-2 TaxID=2853257 RepID=UPI001C5C8465|nr:hypothetical protein [Comamonas sp. Y33R10-2]QXZ09095.1 hypothetical protein KUF54_13825 [Comamonas sp. Y33R10-2]
MPCLLASAMPVAGLAGLHAGADLALSWCAQTVYLHRNEDVMVLYPLFGASLEP